MDKVRKVLVAVFAALSIYFAWTAFWQMRESMEAQNLARDGWGHEVLTAARKYDRLVFFTMDGSSMSPLSAKSEKILDRSYVRAKLDSKSFPADYEAVQRIYRLSGAKGLADFGILSPRGYPVFLAKKFALDPESPLGQERVIEGSAWVYRKKKNEIKSVLGVAVSKAGADRRISELPQLFPGGQISSELVNMRIFFTAESWGDSTALLSENARIVARIAAMGDPFAVEVASIAKDKLIKALDRKDINFSQRLLLLRALYDFVLTSNSASAKRVAYEGSAFVADKLSSDGFFTDGGDILLRENALAISIMARASKVFGDDRFSKALAISTNAIVRKLAEHTTAPALLCRNGNWDMRSEAAALDYVLLSRAWIDAYLAIGDQSYLRLARKAFEKLDSDYMDPSTMAWFENGKNSVFANVYRYSVYADSAYPSTVGEGLQILADIYSLKNEIPQRFVRILSPLSAASSASFFQDKASIRLSVLLNPMRAFPKPSEN